MRNGLWKRFMNYMLWEVVEGDLSNRQNLYLGYSQSLCNWKGYSVFSTDLLHLRHSPLPVDGDEVQGTQPKEVHL